MRWTRVIFWPVPSVCLFVCLLTWYLKKFGFICRKLDDHGSRDNWLIFSHCGMWQWAWLHVKMYLTHFSRFEMSSAALSGNLWKIMLLIYRIAQFSCLWICYVFLQKSWWCMGLGHLWAGWCSCFGLPTWHEGKGELVITYQFHLILLLLSLLWLHERIKRKIYQNHTSLCPSLTFHIWFNIFLHAVLAWCGQLKPNDPVPQV